MKELKGVYYCMNCQALVREKHAVEYDEENGQYCPYCDGLLYKVRVIPNGNQSS